MIPSNFFEFKNARRSNKIKQIQICPPDSPYIPPITALPSWCIIMRCETHLVLSFRVIPFPSFPILFHPFLLQLLRVLNLVPCKSATVTPLPVIPGLTAQRWTPWYCTLATTADYKLHVANTTTHDFTCCIMLFGNLKVAITWHDSICTTSLSTATSTKHSDILDEPEERFALRRICFHLLNHWRESAMDRFSIFLCCQLSIPGYRVENAEATEAVGNHEK